MRPPPRRPAFTPHPRSTAIPAGRQCARPPDSPSLLPGTLPGTGEDTAPSSSPSPEVRELKGAAPTPRQCAAEPTGEPRAQGPLGPRAGGHRAQRPATGTAPAPAGSGSLGALPGPRRPCGAGGCGRDADWGGTKHEGPRQTATDRAPPPASGPGNRTRRKEPGVTRGASEPERGREGPRTASEGGHTPAGPLGADGRHSASLCSLHGPRGVRRTEAHAREAGPRR